MLSLSTLELRNIFESSFLPMRCQCTLGADESLTVKVFNKKSARVDLMVTGICASKLDSNRAICELITGLRHDLEHGRGRRQGEVQARVR